ncbi:hypothetical protein MY4038_002602 [Beauveria bassiana]
MKVSTTSFLLASLYGSALAAPVGDDLGGTLESLTNTAGLGNAPLGNIVPENDLTKGLTGAVGQSGSVVGRDAPIGGDIVGDVVGDALLPVTGKDGLVNDLTKGLTGADGQPGNIVGRDGEQKASVVLPNYNFIATDHTADVNIKADATNVNARNLDANVKAHPLKEPPPTPSPPGAVDLLTDAVASGVTLADNVAEPTGSVDSALEDATGPDVSGVQALPTGNL